MKTLQEKLNVKQLNLSMHIIALFIKTKSIT